MKKNNKGKMLHWRSRFRIIIFFDICVAMYTLDPDFYCILVYIRHSLIYLL